MIVNNKGNHSYEANGLVLNIGTNIVDEEAFDQFLAHPLMAELDEKGEFNYEKGKPSAKDLIALVKDTFDLDTLEQMKADEDRKTVKDAIDEQIAGLKGE